MSRGRASNSNLDIGLAWPFHRAALSGRFIGVAALSLGGVILYRAHAEKTARPDSSVAILVIFALSFLAPGVLYLVLAAWVARRRRWAILCSLGMAMLDMLFQGVLFVTSWGAPGAAVMCPVAALFVVALAVMTTYLGRSLEALKHLATS